MSKEDWVACSERYPDMKIVSISEYIETSCSGLCLVQTKKNDMFVADCLKTKSKYKDGTEVYEWFSYGTGGRRMKVMSTVIAWQPLPEKYEG